MDEMIDGISRQADGAFIAPFDLTRFLAGRMRAWGVFEDRAGRSRRRFVVDLDGRRDGSRFILDERFEFDDGVIEERRWVFLVESDGSFTATSPDVVGMAQGRSSAGEARMRYVFRLQVSGRSINVEFDDRFYRIDDDRAINRATISKFGVRLGELTILFDRRAGLGGGTGAAGTLSTTEGRIAA